MESEKAVTADRRVLIIVPTYNERETLPELLPHIWQALPEAQVLVVDDNSPDATGAWARQAAESEPRLEVSERPTKLGLGSAYIHGFQYALERDYAYIFEMDADFSHDPAALPTLLEVAEHEADLAIGSRYLSGVNVVNWPMRRLLLSYGANRYARWVTGLPLHDSTSGFKCFRRRILETIDLDAVRSNGYAFQIEMNFRAWRGGFRLKEVPIVFVDRNIGVSKMSRTIIWEAVWMVWRLRLAALLGRI